MKVVWVTTNSALEKALLHKENGWVRKLAHLV